MSAVATQNGQKRTLIELSEGSRSVGFSGSSDFALTLRVAEMLSQSEFVPDSYRAIKKGVNNPTGVANCAVALELSQRMNIHWMAVMQNLYVVHGRPAWMASFVIATVNACGRFNSLRFELTGQGDTRQCIAWTTERSTPIPPNVRTLADAQKANLPILESTPITWKMAVAEGWTTKAGSKWMTMPDQMFRYRAAAFWSRAYAPELLMGFMTHDEAEDVADASEIVNSPPAPRDRASLASRIAGKNIPAETVEAEIVEQTIEDPVPPTETPTKPAKAAKQAEPKPAEKPAAKKQDQTHEQITNDQADEIDVAMKQAGWTINEVLAGFKTISGGDVMSLMQLSKEQASKALANIYASMESKGE